MFLPHISLKINSIKRGKLFARAYSALYNGTLIWCPRAVWPSPSEMASNGHHAMPGSYSITAVLLLFVYRIIKKSPIDDRTWWIGSPLVLCHLHPPTAHPPASSCPQSPPAHLMYSCRGPTLVVSLSRKAGPAAAAISTRGLVARAVAHYPLRGKRLTYLRMV